MRYIKQVTFLAEDFNTLDFKNNEGIFNEQYTDLGDCPLARAVKRRVGEDAKVCVGVNEIDINGNDNQPMNYFGDDKAQEIATRVAKNGSAIFRFGIELKID